MNLFAAFKVIYAFFFKQELKSRRTKIFIALSMVPVAIMLLAKIVEMTHPRGDVTAEAVFSRVLLVVYIQLLIPVLALLFGSIIINEEMDHKTLVFLNTAPIPKPSVVIGKYAAYATLVSLMVSVGLALSFLIMNINHMGKMVHVDDFLRFWGAGLLALITYMALFTLLGTVMKKSLIFGLFFIFGWENVVQYFPGTTQKFTVIHYIKSLLPYAHEKNAFLRILLARLEPSSPAEAITILLILTVVVLAAASYVFQNKEYIISDAV
jgi:ABC-type transport system involved in multi-copper enzyme maturation permease subunit